MAADKIATNETPPAVSAPEFAQGLVEALQKIAAAAGETTLIPAGSDADGAIAQYKLIAADLETLPLKR